MDCSSLLEISNKLAGEVSLTLIKCIELFDSCKNTLDMSLILDIFLVVLVRISTSFTVTLDDGIFGTLSTLVGCTFDQGV